MKVNEDGTAEADICLVCGLPAEDVRKVNGRWVSWPMLHEHDLPQTAGRREPEAVRLRQCYGTQAAIEAHASACMDGLAAPKAVDAAARQLVADALNEPRAARRGLLVYGANGVGKTYLAAAVANEVIANGGRCRWVRLESLMRQGSQAMELEICRACSKALSLVVLDDFGSERKSSFGVAQTFAMVDALYEAKATLLVTTNLTRSQIASPATVEARRVLDRIKERCRCVAYEGPNKRQQAVEGQR